MNPFLAKIANDDSLIRLIERNLPSKTSSSSGRYKFDCPSCVRRGYTRDTRGRCAVFSSGNSCGLFCFNCNLRIKWTPGSYIGREWRLFLEDLGCSDDEVKKLLHDNFRFTQMLEGSHLSEERDLSTAVFAPRPLPDRAKPITKWLEEGFAESDFIECAEYALKRMGDFNDAHWSPVTEFRRRIIMPCRQRFRNVGWIARCIDDAKTKYFEDLPSNFLYNTDVAFDHNRKFCIISEGVFDAKATSGVAFLGQRPTDQQIFDLNNSGLEIIACPHNDRNGDALAIIAITNKWHISYPYLAPNSIDPARWEEGINDPGEAAERYGKLYTIESIISSATNDPDKIEVRRKRVVSAFTKDIVTTWQTRSLEKKNKVYY